MRWMSKPKAGVWLVMLSVAALWTGQPGRAVAEDFSFGTRLTPQAMLAHELVIRAQVQFNNRVQLFPDQLVRARILLDEALKINPQDAEAWLFRAELAEQLKDRRATLDALQHYCKLRPEDDATQLRYVMTSIGRLQTMNERLDAVERILDSTEAERLSAPLRSRLASYAAEAARDMGDTQRFAMRLLQAVKLDASNAQAAKLTYTLAASRGALPRDLGIAAMAIVKASPADPDARALLGTILLSQGVYDRASEQFGEVGSLAGRPFSLSDFSTYFPGLVVSLGADGHDADALKLLSLAEDAIPRIRSGKASEPGHESDEAALPTLSLPLDLELIRLALYAQSGETAAATGTFGRIRERLRERLDAGDATAAGDLAWVSVLFNRNMEEVPALYKAYTEKVGDKGSLARRVAGWMAIRNNKQDQGRAILEPLANDDGFAAYGLSHALDGKDEQRRLNYLRQAMAVAPAGLSAVMAAHELRDAGQKVQPTGDGAYLAERMAEWPKLLSSLDLKKSPLIQMKLVIDRQVLTYLEPMEAHIQIKSYSDLPLSVGPDATVPTKVIFYVSPANSGVVMTSSIPLVADVGRTLRLEPHKTLDVPVRLDTSQLGFLLDAVPMERITCGVTAILDPHPLPSGGVAPGIMGDTDTVTLVQRQSLTISDVNISDWLNSLKESADPVERFKGLAVLGQVGTHLGTAAEAKVYAVKIVDTLNKSFPGFSPTTQAWLLCFLPRADDGPSPYRPIFEAAQRSSDDLVQILYLASQVTKPDSNEMNAALRQTGLIGEYAQAQKIAIIRAAKEEAEAKARAAAEPTAPTAAPTNDSAGPSIDLGPAPPGGASLREPDVTPAPTPAPGH